MGNKRKGDVFSWPDAEAKTMIKAGQCEKYEPIENEMLNRDSQKPLILPEKQIENRVEKQEIVNEPVKKVTPKKRYRKKK